MARSAGFAIENNFSKGLITEAHGLNFPENAVTDGINFTLNRDGSLSRRFGIDYETGYEQSSVTRNGYAMTEYLWESVGGNGDLNFVVVQVGPTLYYYEVTSDGILSANKKSFTTDLTLYQVATPDAYPCQYGSGDGKLFVAHPKVRATYTEYDVDTDSITTTIIPVEIRDFEGVEDGLEIDERPLTLSMEHRYNLYNQGWYLDEVTTDTSGGDTANPIDRFFDRMDAYPSNADVWWLFKDSLDQFKPSESGTTAIGNTPAPKGHFLLNPFNTDRSDIDPDITDVEETSAGENRCKTVAFFSGRAWLAGCDAPDYNTTVYFSRIIEKNDHISQMHQQNDPTSEELFDLLPTDGGVVRIQDAGSITKLFPIQDKLLVLATNGIWSIQGSEGVGFKANDFSVVKLSGIGVNSSLSIVNVDGLPFFWNSDGIYTITPTEFGSLDVKSLTDKTIQTFYNDIPQVNKKFAKGAYNALTKTIKWTYRSDSFVGFHTLYYNHNAVLCLDLNLGAFYPYEVQTGINSTYPYINGIIGVSNQLLSSATDDRFFYVTTKLVGGTSYNLTFSRESDTNFQDWDVASTNNPSTYETYLITGYKLRGGAAKKFQSNYMWVFTDFIEGNSCYVQGIWDYATNDDTQRFTIEQECCLSEFSTRYQIRRLKIRGSGLALQYKFFSNGRNPFKLIGWSTFETSNEGP